MVFTHRAALNALCRTLAAEEPEIIAVALRPGVVDTPMQAELIADGKCLRLFSVSRRASRDTSNANAIYMSSQGTNV